MQNFYEQLFKQNTSSGSFWKLWVFSIHAKFTHVLLNCFLLSLIEKHLNGPIYYNFSFLIEKNYYTIVLIAFDFVLFLSTFSVILNDYFFWWLVYKSLVSRFLVLISCTMWSYNLFSVSNIFQGPGFYGPGFSGSESRIRNQVFEVAQL